MRYDATAPLPDAPFLKVRLAWWPPRSYANQIYNITQWTTMPQGRYFAVIEEQSQLIKDIRKFARSLD